MKLRDRIYAITASATVAVTLLAGATSIEAQTLRTWSGAAGDGLWETDALADEFGIGNWSFSSAPGSLTATANNTSISHYAVFNSGADVTVTHYRKLGGIRLTAANSDTVTISGFADTLPNTGIAFMIHPGVVSGDQYTSSDLNNSIDVQGGHLVLNGALNEDDEIIDGNGNLRFGQASSAWNVADGSTATFNVLVQLVNTQTQIRKRGAGTVILNGNGTSAGSAGGGNSTSAADAFNWHIEEGTLVGASGADTQWRANATGVTITSGATVHLTNGTNWGPNAAQTAAGNDLKYSEIAGTGVGGLGAIRVSNGDSLLQTGTNAAAGGNPNSLRLVSFSTGIGVDDGASLTITDDIGGSGGLTKLGDGTLILTAKNHYAGDTTVSAGTLLINAQREDVVKTITSVNAYAAATNTTQIVVDSTTDLSVGQLANGFWTLGAYNATVNTFVQGDASSIVDSTVTFHGIDAALASFQAIVESGATLGGSGKINGTAVNVQSGGTLAPGASIGDFDVGSATINNGGILKIEFGGNEIDKLAVNGALDLAGAVFDFSSLGNLANGEYIFATYDSILGSSFTTLNLPDSLMVHHDTTNKYFSLIGEFSSGTTPGDYNGDGFVNAADYVVWRDTLIDGDNGYLAWKANFGAGPEGSGMAVAQHAAVPEPSALGLLGVVLAVSVAVRSRRA